MLPQSHHCEELKHEPKKKNKDFLILCFPHNCKYYMGYRMQTETVLFCHNLKVLKGMYVTSGRLKALKNLEFLKVLFCVQ